jgi:hypothetical protein
VHPFPGLISFDIDGGVGERLRGLGDGWFHGMQLVRSFALNVELFPSSVTRCNATRLFRKYIHDGHGETASAKDKQLRKEGKKKA